MTTRDDNVKVFISYSWSSPQHEQFVLTLAEKLMADGVHVLLDKWDLKEGHDKYAFMEQMVTDVNVSKVLVISDKKYASKADNRSGGVGTESQIISNEVYSKVSQEKFIPIVAEYDGTAPCLPAFLKSLIYIDLTKEETYYDEHERLIRNIYNRPKLTKPMLGKPPAHIFDDNPTKLETASIFTSLKESIEKERKSSSKLGDDFLNQIIETLEASRITDSADIDDKIVASVTLFKPYRDQFVEYIKLLCSYDLIESRKEDIFSFLEKLLALHDAPKSMNSFFNELWFDSYKIIGMELFLYLTAVLINKSKYDVINFFLTEKYYTDGIRGARTKEYCEFNHHIRGLDELRKQRLKLNRISVTADMLHDAADIKGVSFDLIMQADFILCLRSIFSSDSRCSIWFPRTLVYKGRWNSSAFEIFQRAESARGFEVIKKLLSITSKTHLVAKLEAAYKLHNLEQWRFDYEPIPFENYLNLDNLYNG